MTGALKIIRFVVLGGLAAGILAACSIGGDDEDPTQTPVVITATPSLTSDSAESDDSDEPTATAAPTNTPPATTPTAEPTATPEPTSTPRPTAILAPTATRAPIVTATSPPTPSPTPGASGGLEIPADLLTILPVEADLPAGMVLVEEGDADIEIVASDFPDVDARQQQLVDWGFQRAAFREFEFPDDQIVDQASQPIGFISRAVLFGSPDAARAEMNSFTDVIVLADPDVATEEIAVAPIGDAHRAVRAAFTDDEGTGFSIAFLGVTAGPISFQFISAGGAQYDPMPDAIAAAEASLGYLGYAPNPTLGAVLLETDFSTWPTGELESGVLSFGEDGYYHVLVDQGSGSFVSAYSTDHEPFTDIAVSVDMRVVSGDPTAQGCVLTRVDQVNQQFDYALCVDANGNVEVLFEQFDADGNYSVEPLLPGGIVTVPPPVEWTTLTIITHGDEFWFLIDGELIDSVQHTGPPEGAVGVIVNHYVEAPEVPAEFVFTNLVVQAVE